MESQLVLSLFPGADLLGRAFEEQGMCIVRGPDKLWGGDVREFHAPSGKFDGVIGGPPCQMFSKAAISGSPAENLIPEFVRLVDETKPRWAVMENVPQARWAAPDWPSVTIRDFDVGGLTFRTRTFWFYGIDPAPVPTRLPGEPEWSVLASNWQTRGKSSYLRRVQALGGCEAGRLMGYPELAERLVNNQPGGLQANGKWRGQGAQTAA